VRRIAATGARSTRRFPLRPLALRSSVAVLPFQPSGVHGGGGINVLAQDPDASDRWLAGGDVAGILATVDGAKSWQSSSAGFQGRPHIACVAVDPSDNQTWYCGEGVQTGINSASGGFYSSTDGGMTWTNLPAPGTIAFCGNGNVAQEADTGGPRSVGKLIQVISAALYAGTFSDGVFVSTDGGTTWNPLGLQKGLVRCLALASPSDTTMWVGLHDQRFAVQSASWSSGVVTMTTAVPNGYSSGQTIQVRNVNPNGYNGNWVINRVDDSTFTFSTSNPGSYVSGGSTVEDSVSALFGLWTLTTAGVAAQANTPAAVRTVEEILWISSSVGYAACHSAGIYQTADGGATWVATGGNATLPDTSQWCSIDGYHDEGTGEDVLIVGCTNPQPVGGGQYGSLYMSSDSGDTWTCITTESSLISTLVYGKALEWWMNTTNSDNLLGRSSYVAQQIVRDPQVSLRWLVSGRSGVWITVDNGIHWSPAVYHLPPTAHRFAALDPTNSARLCLWSDDWEYFGSGDNLASIVQRTNPDGINTMGGMDIADDGTVYISGGSASGSAVGSASDPLGTFSDLAFPTGAATPRGLITGRDGTSQRVVLVVAPGDGIYGKFGSGSWSIVCPNTIAFHDPPPGSPPPTYLAWPPGQPVVFAFDANVGVVKNINYGASSPEPWFVYWDKTTTSDVAQIACDSLGNLYVAVGSQLFRITGALSLDTDPPDPSTQITDLDFNCDALGMTPGGVPIIATKPANGVPGTIQRSFDQGDSWPDFTDDFYRSFSENVEAVRASNDGWIYIGTNGEGAYAGRYG